MGFWYFLTLFLGLFLVINGLFMKNSSLVRKISCTALGILFVSFSIFMFLPGSAEIIAGLLKMNG